MKDDNWVLCEVEDGVWEERYWPFCAIDGCTNRQYFNSDKCWPHTTGAPLDHNCSEVERQIYELGIGRVLEGEEVRKLV